MSGLGVAAGGVGGEPFEARRVGCLPLRKELVHSGLESGKLRVAEDGRVDIACWSARSKPGAWTAVNRAARTTGEHLPVVGKGIDVTLGDTAAHVAV